MLWQHDDLEVGGQQAGRYAPPGWIPARKNPPPSLDHALDKLLDLICRRSVPPRVFKLREGVAPPFPGGVRVDRGEARGSSTNPGLLVHDHTSPPGLRGLVCLRPI